MQFGNPIVNGGNVNAISSQFIAASGTVPATIGQSIISLNNVVYPAGLSAASFHGCSINFVNSGGGGLSSGSISVGITDGLNGNALWQQTISWNQFTNIGIGNDPTSYSIPLPLSFGALSALAGDASIWIQNSLNEPVFYVIIFDQTNITPASLIAGIVEGLTLPTELIGFQLAQEVYEIGGVQQTSGTIASVVTTQILAAPPAGKVYRLHSFCATTTNQILNLIAGGQPMASVTSPQFIYLGGLLVNQSISIAASANVNMAYNLRWDQINTPTIS
jgi:hypothetical protein